MCIFARNQNGISTGESDVGSYDESVGSMRLNSYMAIGSESYYMDRARPTREELCEFPSALTVFVIIIVNGAIGRTCANA